MNRNRSSEFLRHAARRASQHSFFLAADLEQFRVRQGMEEGQLARFLGCAPEVLPRLALCRRPDPQSPSFRSDIQRIASALGLQQDRLAQLVRQTDVLKTLGRAGPDADQEAASGLLMAARDAEIDRSAGEEGPTGDSGDDQEDRT